jgi:hypothetical protein
MAIFLETGFKAFAILVLTWLLVHRTSPVFEVSAFSRQMSNIGITGVPYLSSDSSNAQNCSYNRPWHSTSRYPARKSANGDLLM